MYSQSFRPPVPPHTPTIAIRDQNGQNTVTEHSLTGSDVLSVVSVVFFLKFKIIEIIQKIIIAETAAGPTTGIPSSCIKERRCRLVAIGDTRSVAQHSFSRDSRLMFRPCSVTLHH